MIEIVRTREDFEYDIRSLVKAFYKDEEVTFTECNNSTLKLSFGLYENRITLTITDNEKELFADEKEVVLEGRREYKNVLKRMIYNALTNITHKTLPWGTLTGIRPIKLPMEKLEQGVPDEEILKDLKETYLCSDEKSKLSLDIAKKELDILREQDYKNGYSIYIGIPFCPSTCLYCSFTSYSIELFAHLVDDYLKALFKEIEYASKCDFKRLSTVYIGGGTPTTLNEEQLERLLSKVKKEFDFTYVSEFTVEAGRPDSITKEKLEVLKKYGVTRISINPQTMCQHTLDVIGRKHTVDDIIDSFKLAREVGHENINMDIILGLPGENMEDVAHTLHEIHKLNPDSLTVHTLAVKRAANLNIYKEKYNATLPSDVSSMLAATVAYAKDAGYIPYYLYRQKNMSDNLENIGYAKEGKEGIYNILIMEEKQTIVALGAGASSKFVFLDEDRIERVENVKSVKDYIERIDEMINRKKSFIEGNYESLCKQMRLK